MAAGIRLQTAAGDVEIRRVARLSVVVNHIARLLRLTQGAATGMHFASHNGGTRLRVFGWPDGSNTIGSFDVTVGAWSSGPYSAPGPGGVEWLSRVDSRITGAWISGTRAGFLWTAAAKAGRPLPYVKGAVVDVTTRALAEEPDIWNQQSAFAYPAAARTRRASSGCRCSSVADSDTRHTSSASVTAAIGGWPSPEPAHTGQTADGATTSRASVIIRNPRSGWPPVTRCRAVRTVETSNHNTCISESADTDDESVLSRHLPGEQPTPTD